MRFAVVGGDRRSALLCALLAADGHRVYTYALENAALPAEIPGSGCLQGCVYGADCVVLGVPAEKGGVISTPLGEEPLETERLMDALWKGQLLCGGGLSRSLRAAALANGITAEDMMERPDFAWGNAALTAEGALEILLRESERSLYHSRVLVLGWGRVGRSLTRRLCALGAAVTVAARREEIRAQARTEGCQALSFPQAADLSGYDFVVNTVPARLLPEAALCTAGEPLLLELASPPGGFHKGLAENLGLRLVEAPGLPGKCAPYAAAELMKRTVYDILSEQGESR